MPSNKAVIQWRFGVVVVLAACAPFVAEVDGGDLTPTDAGSSARDAGPSEDGGTDASAPSDAGVPNDAGAPLDAGASPDGGSSVADGGPDAGGGPDGGSGDGGPGDGGADAGSPDAGAAGVAVAVTRQPSTGLIELAIHLTRPGLVDVVVTGVATAAPPAQSSPTSYSSQLTPSASSGAVDVLVRATMGADVAEWRRTLLVLPAVGASWNQPEAVPGLVNTAGYEDGPEVSPDGEWLVVTDYSPMDIIACAFTNGGRRPSNPLCTTALGPSTAPERPQMPGASRVAPFLNRCPRLCFTSNGLGDGGDLDPAFAEANGIVLPPVSAYVFRRQPDGTFSEPAALVYEADGCAHLMGVSFVTVDGGAAGVVFAYDGDGVSPLHRVQYAAIALGQRNALGAYSCTATWTATLAGKTPVDVTPAGSLGNPNVGGGFLWVDDEAGGDLRFRTLTGALPDASVSAEAEVAHRSDGGQRRSMPFFHAPTRRLYFSRGNQAIDARELVGANPAASSAWGPALPVISADTATSVGRIYSVGEPSVADLPDGGRELYFIYALKTDAGVNMNVGRVPAR